MTRQSEQPTPTIRYTGRRWLHLLATIPLLTALIWGTWHLSALVALLAGRQASPLAVTFAVTFCMLWWVVLAWFEKPFTATPEQQAYLDRLIVTVQIPAYNEDPYALQRCIQSLFEQTRRPDRIRVVDDGSTDPGPYEPVKAWLFEQAHHAGIVATWDRTVNRGKRYAQMHVLADDPGDIFITLDSDSVLEQQAVAEGLKPFADGKVMSVAGMVAVWNSKANFLTMLTCMLYTPFTRGFRSAQSVLKQVMVNSGTLAFYRGHVIRNFAGAYENETLFGQPMQMNDDSFMTFAALLEGHAVHQPTAVAFTLAPDKPRHYFNQQLRWMRGTFVRQAWWVRYLSPKTAAWWMPVVEFSSFLLSIVVAGVLMFDGDVTIADPIRFWTITAVVGIALNYIVSLRYFIFSRSDESLAFQVATFALAPVAGLWRLAFLRALMVYAILTFWKVGRWGTRATVEVGAGGTAPAVRGPDGAGSEVTTASLPIAAPPAVTVAGRAPVRRPRHRWDDMTDKTVPIRIPAVAPSEQAWVRQRQPINERAGV